MLVMTKIDRVLAVIHGQKPDRPPISFCHHFRPEQRRGSAAVAAHLKHLAKYDLDLLKVMFDLGYPLLEPVQSIDQLADLTPLSGDEGVFAEHLAVIRDLTAALKGQVLFVTTIFNAWATLRRMLSQKPHRPGAGPSPLDDPHNAYVASLVRENPAASAAALTVIGQSLANFARRCIEAGCDGVFLSVRDDWVELVSPGFYDELVRPTDLHILAGAAAGRCNILHACGAPVNFKAFAEYPVQAINWGDRLAGPAISSVGGWLKPAPCGGLNQRDTLVRGTPQDCLDELRDALDQAGSRPILIAPGCTYDPALVPEQNLHAVRRAVEDFRY